ncbi:MAG: YDG domain-containing protein [Clostridia bacterium]|nr:YDG domain-containing protein [Clostridia bacterium]
MKKIICFAALLVLSVAVACFGLNVQAGGYADTPQPYIIQANTLGYTVTHGSQARTYLEFQDILEDAEDNATLMFGDGSSTVDIGFGRLIFDTDKSFTLEGRISSASLSSVILLGGSGNLTLSDAKIHNRLWGDVIQHAGTGTLSLQGPETELSAFIGSLIVNNDAGEVFITGGIYNSMARNIVNTANGTVTLDGGSFRNTGFTNTVYNTGEGTVNLGGTAELYSNSGTRTVNNLGGGTVNITGNASLKHVQLGNIIDEEGVIGNDMGKINNYSVYNASPTGMVNFGDSPVIKGKVYIQQPANVINNSLADLEVPIVLEYPDLRKDMTVVTGCTDTSLFRLSSAGLRLSVVGNDLTTKTKHYIYYVSNGEGEYLLEADNTLLLQSGQIESIMKYINDEAYESSNKTVTIYFQNNPDNQVDLYNNDSVIFDKGYRYIIMGSGLANTDPANPLIVVDNDDAVVEINSGYYTAQGLALLAAEGTADLKGGRFSTMRADNGLIQVQTGAEVKVQNVPFYSDDNNEITFTIASELLFGNDIKSVSSLLTDAAIGAAIVIDSLESSPVSEFFISDEQGVYYEFETGDLSILVTSVKVVLLDTNNEYTISFNTLSDGDIPNYEKTYYYGVGMELESPEHREGYTFEGWYGYYIPVLEIYGNRYDSISPSQRGNLTLYAQWEFGAPTISFPDLTDNLLEEMYDGDTKEITPQISHKIEDASITYSYFWFKESGVTFVPYHNRMSLEVANVDDSGVYRLGVTATRNGNVSEPAFYNITVVITPRPLTVTGGIHITEDKVYDGNDDATKNVNGSCVFIGDDNLDYINYSYTAFFADKNAGTNKPIHVVFHCENNNYTINDYEMRGDILKKDLTVTDLSANGKVYDGNTDILLSGGIMHGVVGGDDVQLIKAAYADSADAGTRIVTTLLSLSGGDAANYNLVQPEDLSTTITPKTVSVTWGMTEFVYSGTPVAPTAIAEVGANDETVQITVNGAQKDAAEFEYIAIAQPTSDNYMLSNAVTRFTVAPLTVEIDWGELEFKYDGNLKKVNPVITNLHPSDSGVALIVSNGYQTEIGDYTAVITGINSLNYQLPQEGLSAVYSIITDTVQTQGLKGSVVYEKGFGDGIQVKLEKKKADNNSLLKGYLEGKMQSNGTYTVSILKDGVLAATEGLLTVTFEAKGITLLKDPKVLIVENGEVVEKALTLDGNMATFTTTSTGDFMLVSTRTNTLYFIMLAAAVLVFLIVILAFAFTRKYSIEFVTDGTPVETTKIMGGKRLFLLPSRKEDAIFKGWTLDEHGTKPFKAAKMPRKNIKLYAQWEQRNFEGFDLAKRKAGI